MIDIHCHLLYGVDDGAKTIEESVKMLMLNKKQGIDGVVLTPHLRHGMFRYDNEKIMAHYEALRPYADKLGVKIYLGTEYHVDSDMVPAFRRGDCHTLADGKHILTEYSHLSDYAFIRKMTQEAMLAGYIPVLAHVERYECLEDIDCIDELREMGALIQVNADAVLGLDGRRPKKFCKTLLKNELIDIVASDCHGIANRSNHMGDAYAYVSKKFGQDYAMDVFLRNPQKIL